jgi:hypothetical protein
LAFVGDVVLLRFNVLTEVYMEEVTGLALGELLAEDFAGLELGELFADELGLGELVAEDFVGLAEEVFVRLPLLLLSFPLRLGGRYAETNASIIIWAAICSIVKSCTVIGNV